MRVLGKLSARRPGPCDRLFRATCSTDGRDTDRCGAGPVQPDAYAYSFPAHEIVVVVSPEPASITAAYALIKHTSGAPSGKQHFHVLVNKAGTEAEAKMIFDNMADVARRYLAVSLDFQGFVPSDGKLCLGRRVAGAAPPLLQPPRFAGSGIAD